MKPLAAEKLFSGTEQKPRRWVLPPERRCSALAAFVGLGFVNAMAL